VGGDLEDEGSGWSGLFGDFDSGKLDSSCNFLLSQGPRDRWREVHESSVYAGDLELAGP
jgi:hypothetical protein